MLKEKGGAKMMPSNKAVIEKGSLEDFENYNREYDKDKYTQYSEARKFDLNAAKTWLAIRSALTYVDEYSEGDWRTLQIVESRSKYGTNYIFIDLENKRWRTRPTAGEFYGYTGKTFDMNEFKERIG